ncbi:MAG: TolC family protein [Ferruginibacter sp.]
MKNSIRILTLFFGLSISAVLKAQIPQRISIRNAIEMSIKNSNNLLISDARIQQAIIAVKEARDKQLPDASVTGSYVRLGSAKIDLKNNPPNSTNNMPNVNQALYGIMNISMPLYAGGRIKYGIESAKYLVEAAKLSGENEKEAVIFNTIQAYANLYKASKAIAVINENLAASSQRDSTFSRLERNGLLARNDLLKAQLQSSNIELNLLDAQNNLVIANVNMALMLGLPENLSIEIDSSFVSTLRPLQTFAEFENLALKNRKDIMAIDFEKKAVATNVKIAKASGYPSLAVTGGYIAADIPRFITITNAVNIGIGFQYNLASLWKTNTKLKQAITRQSELNAMSNMLNDATRLQVNKDFQDYLLWQKKIEVYNKAVVQATENSRITKKKYDNNLVTITDLLEANVLLLQTKLNAANARADVALAYDKLLLTSGILSK